MGDTDFTIHFDGAIIVVVYPKIASIEAIDRYVDMVTQFATDCEAFAVLADIRPLQTTKMRSPVRNHFFKKSDAFDDGPHGTKLRAEAIVLDNVMLRALVSAYYWFKGDKWYPSKVFKDLESARAFCEAQLALSKQAS